MEFSIEVEVTEGIQGGGSVMDGEVSIILGCGDHGITFKGTEENIRKLIAEMKDTFDSMFPA